MVLMTKEHGSLLEWEKNKDLSEENFCIQWNKLMSGETYCLSHFSLDFFGNWTVVHQRENIHYTAKIRNGLRSFDGKIMTRATLEQVKESYTQDEYEDEHNR